MNILVVSSKYPPEYAGSGLRAHNTYKRLANKYGIEFDVIASSVLSNKNRQYVVDYVSVKLIANKLNKRIGLRKYDSPFGRIIKRIVNKLFSLQDYWMEALPTFSYLIRNHQQYDLIHVFGNVNVTSAAISYAKITDKPIIVELVNLTDNPHQYEPKILSLLFGKGFPKQSLLVCISQYLKWLCHKYGYTDKQIWCRPNPVNENKFFYEPNSKKKYREMLSINSAETDVILLYLAKFMPLKNQLFLIDVMPYLPDNYKLMLVGPLIDSGPLLARDRGYYQSVLNAIARKGLEARVSINSQFIEKPEQYIKAADVFVMPSTREAFGTPVLEALACGVPIVANDIPGVFDQLVKDGVNGYICKLDHKEWSKKIILAARIDKDIMCFASQDVLNVASTKVIDYEYYNRLSSLVKKPLQ